MISDDDQTPEKKSAEAPVSYHAWQPELRMAQLEDEQIRRLVYTFYDKIRQHDELGPVFENKLSGAWEPHLEKMVDFWATMMTGQQRYEGRPLPAHIGLPGMEDHHFTQWLVLFRETVNELFSPELAAQFIERAERMAQSFRFAIALHQGNAKL